MKKLLVLLALVVPLNLWTAPATAGNSPLPVYVSILPQKYFVERIGGDRVAVSVMVGPAKSPATYEPTPKQMQNLAAARLYFSIGVPFEKIWLKRLQSNHPQMRIIDTLEGVQLLPMAAHHHGEEERHKDADNGAGREEEILDPHVWTSPPRVKIMAKRILKALVEELPGHEKELSANCETFLADLNRLTEDIQQKLEPVRNRSFLVFHPSWGYFADTFKLEQVAIENEGKEPGARTLNHVIKFAQKRNIRVIFVQKQFSSVAARMIADAIGGRIEAVDPLAEDYLDNLRRVANILAEAMTQ